VPNGDDSGIFAASFQTTDIVLLDTHAGGQLFLGQLRLNATAANIFSNHPPDIHGGSAQSKLLILIRTGSLMQLLFAVAKSTSADTDKESAKTLSVARAPSFARIPEP
jgi:hypothetical protein